MKGAPAVTNPVVHALSANVDKTVGDAGRSGDAAGSFRVVKAFGRYLGPDEIRAVVAVREWYGGHPEIPDDQRPRQFRR
ncbi:hypothetical protein ACFXHA_18810 [Nocardia sp. NPDC059240]|uniref:hypothetical protein n=1 Tax=Nocardia sp. NPDC059240 TaxID=3346786 RepID=UPI0036B716C5